MTLMPDDYLRQRGAGSAIEIIYTYPRVAQLLRNCLFLQRPSGDILPNVFAARDIKYQRGFTLSKVDPNKKLPIPQKARLNPSIF
ncbi:hypothetical protein YEEN111655_16205 [Yersinia entomophaga]